MPVRKLIQSKKAWLSVVLVLVALGFTFGLFGGCGVDYNTPAALATTPALIDEAILDGWMTAGLVNGSGYNNVVILQVDNNCTAYASAHISGSYCVTRSEVIATRTEGVGVYQGYMVADGAMMDALIQRTGIGPNTTIVFVSQRNAHTATYAYFSFRYWGFPKSRLKVMDGTLAEWQAYPLSTDAVVPPPVNSGYSVTRNASLRADLRISFPEMIEIVDEQSPNNVILQGVDPINYASFHTGAVATVSPPGIFGAKQFTYNPNVQSDSFHFQTAGTITTNLTAGPIGGGSTMNHIVYCNSGLFAVPLFFAIDGMLGWPAYYYDGGWLQWGQMADENQVVHGTRPANALAVGLDVNSPWRTDIPTRSTFPITYAVPYSFLPDFVAPLSFDASVNEIEDEDARYMSTGSGGGAGGGGAGGC
ncbi:MAG TPA: hypothetical protein DCO77_09485 [Nitrospiraceae bacterium]|nr:hypothetical protein [Nitrospiraceae bacterium]